MTHNTRRLFALAALIVGFTTAASADVTWTLTADFNRPGFGTNHAAGSFTTTPAILGSFAASPAFNVAVTGTNTAADYTYTLGSTDGGTKVVSLTNVDFTNFSVSPNVYLILDFASNLTNSGGTIALVTGSLACPGCGTLVSGSITGVTGAGITTTVPEPSAIVLLGSVMFICSFVTLRRRNRAQNT